MKEIQDKIDQLTAELKQATDQVNIWLMKRTKIEGALEVLRSMLSESPKEKK